MGVTTKTKSVEITDYLPYLNQIKITPTRYIDLYTLEQLGILDDVLKVLENMGLGKFITMNEPAYEIPTRQFLATVEINYSVPKYFKAEHGYITFTVGGETHEVPFLTLCDLFGFHGASAGDMTQIDFPSGKIPSELWDIVGTGKFEPGSSKAGKIRSPVLRYVHKVLTCTLSTRKETSAVEKGEYYFLMEGVSEFLDKRFSFPNLGAVLAKKLVAVKKSAFKYFTAPKKETGPPVIRFGGIVTTILKHCKVDLNESLPVLGKPTTIDGPHLYDCKILRGISDRGLLVYKFALPRVVQASSNLYPEWGYVELPNRELTSITSRENLLFAPKTEQQYFETQGSLPRAIIASQWPNIESVDNEATLDEDGRSTPQTEISNTSHGIENIAQLLDTPLGKFVYEITNKHEKELARLGKENTQLKKEVAQLREIQ